MGNPSIYGYPDPDGPLKRIDFGEGLQDRHRKPRARVVDDYDGAGRGYRSHLGTNHRFRILLERFGTAGANSLERSFASLEAHLFKGGLVGFSQDHAKTWASVTTTPPVQGTTALTTTGNGFAAWSSSGTPVTGDEIVVESVHPEAQHEIGTANTITGTAVTITLNSPGCWYTYAGSAIVRWRGFYPVCWLPEDQVGKPIVTSDHDRTYTLDLELEYMPQLVMDLYTGDSTFGEVAGEGGRVDVQSTSRPALRDLLSTGGFGGHSLDDLLQGRNRKGAIDIAGWRS